jgi:hypothetical protein
MLRRSLIIDPKDTVYEGIKKSGKPVEMLVIQDEGGTGPAIEFVVGRRQGRQGGAINGSTGAEPNQKT